MPKPYHGQPQPLGAALTSEFSAMIWRALRQAAVAESGSIG